ncbi:MAG: hypothetical protein JNL28_05440 [Planctomycetes bacterium]|nr:hypothetical protein [Planctomycetota bacterium]
MIRARTARLPRTTPICASEFAVPLTRTLGAFLRTVVGCAGLVAAAQADVRLPRIFSDGVVLQREARVAIFGFAAPNEAVRVHTSFGAVSDIAHADASGRWSTTIATPAAGGPHWLEVRGKNTVRVEDVRIGEVWLAAGQSNMEMPVGATPGGYAGVVDWEAVVAAANDPDLRVFDVGRATARAQRDDVAGEWRSASPATVASFSAVAYFAGARLRAELGVPVGIVTAAWGGTTAEAWTSGITLKTLPDFSDEVARLEREVRAPGKVALERERAVEAWLAALEEIDHGLRDGFAAAACDDSTWGRAQVPGPLDGALAELDGLFWLRRTFEFPAAFLGREVTLELGPVDDFDAVFIDGVLIGRTLERDQSRSPRSYSVPRALATPGRHALAVRVLDVAGSAGIMGSAEATRFVVPGHSMPLAGSWRARAGAALAALPARPADVDFGAHTPAALFNGMIAPLTRFNLRGVFWYQGEANRGRAAQYATLFPALIEDWRARFNQAELPFYYVEIAPFAYPGDRGEARELRDAQRRALRLPHTGMVTTADLGDEKDIHPRRKREVGERLAGWALARTYGRELEYSGPLIDASKSGPEAGSDVFVLHFDHAAGLRVVGGRTSGAFEISDGTSPFVPAEARIQGSTVRLRSDRCATPKSARSAEDWPGIPVAIVNDAGLPAASFRLGEDPWITARRGGSESWIVGPAGWTLAAPIASAVEGVPLGNGLLTGLAWGAATVAPSFVSLDLRRSDDWVTERAPSTRSAEWNWRDLTARIHARDTNVVRARYGTPLDARAGQRPLPLVRVNLPFADVAPRAFTLDPTRGELLVPLTHGLLHVFASAARPVWMMRVEGVTLDATWDPNVWLQFPASAERDVHVSGSGRVLTAEILGPEGRELALVMEGVERPGGLEIALTVVDGAEDSDPQGAAKARVKEALGVGYARILGEHVIALRRAQGGASVVLGEAPIQQLYDLARHLAVSGSASGSPPLTVNRAWVEDDPALSSDGRRPQALYGGLSVGGLFESTRSFLEFNWDNRPRYAEFAREFYGVEGVVVPGETALDGSPLFAAGIEALMPVHSAWTSEIFSKHARISADESFARDRAWPLCREIANAVLALAPLGSDGKRHLALSSRNPSLPVDDLSAWSPRDSNHDVALLHAVFANAAYWAEAFGALDESEAWRRARSQLPAFDLDAQGALTLSPGVPYVWSPFAAHHALAIHPLGLLTIEGDEAQRRTISATLDQVFARGTRGLSGVECAALASLAARAGRPESARRCLLEFERVHTLRNGFCVTSTGNGGGGSAGPPALEGNLSLLDAVHEALLQSWGGVVRVFPAASIVWSEAAFADLRAEGGFVISARRVAGVTREVRVRATRGGRLRLRDPFPGLAAQWNRADVTRSGRDLVVELAQDEELVGTASAPR